MRTNVNFNSWLRLYCLEREDVLEAIQYAAWLSNKQRSASDITSIFQFCVKWGDYMCTSDAAASPRGIDFLFDKNRLNVAVSRAQTLVVVVGHPDLATTRVGSLDQFKKVNLLASLLAS